MKTEATPSKISVVIPAKNEAPCIANIIIGCQKYADEIIVIDGNSSDETAEISRELGVKVITDNGKGKGAAIRQVIPVILNKIIVLIDAAQK